MAPSGWSCQANTEEKINQIKIINCCGCWDNRNKGYHEGMVQRSEEIPVEVPAQDKRRNNEKQREFPQEGG